VREKRETTTEREKAHFQLHKTEGNSGYHVSVLLEALFFCADTPNSLMYVSLMWPFLFLLFFLFIETNLSFKLRGLKREEK
jgi:hypothetical protein